MFGLLAFGLLTFGLSVVARRLKTQLARIAGA
jgi:hypothetical protein